MINILGYMLIGASIYGIIRYLSKKKEKTLDERKLELLFPPNKKWLPDDKELPSRERRQFIPSEKWTKEELGWPKED
jgi:hypothetical protein